MLILGILSLDSVTFEVLGHHVYFRVVFGLALQELGDDALVIIDQLN